MTAPLDDRGIRLYGVLDPGNAMHRINANKVHVTRHPTGMITVKFDEHDMRPIIQKGPHEDT